MKKIFRREIVVIILFAIILLIFDYANLPTFLGFNMNNINWDFCMGILNIIIVIILFMITYKTLDKRTIEREKNKNAISSLLIEECYKECLKTIDILNSETVEKFIVPKIDFNSTNFKNSIIENLQNLPFYNENILMDFVRDGQITKKQIEKYLKIKEKYKQYITVRIIFFDGNDLYEPLKIELHKIINIEIKKMKESNNEE